MDSRGDIFDADAVQAMSDAKRSKLVMIPKEQEAAVRLMASFGRCPDSALYEFEIGLGPANAKRLIEFLFTLPPEPDHELEPTNGDSP